MRQRRWFGLLALLAAIALFLGAACSTDDSSGGGDDGGDGGEQAEPATCEGEPGQPAEEEDIEAEGELPDGAGQRVGLVFDIGGQGDLSFNDSAFAGLDRAEQDLGVEIRALEPAEDGANRGPLLRSLAEEGFGMVIGVGFAFAQDMEAVAADFPETRFAIVDDASFEAPNVTSLTFAEEQGSFLVGAAAALATGTNQIGFIGGVENPLIQKFEAGYVAGARAVNPDIEIDIKYISQPPDFSGFEDPASAGTIAEGQFSAGADVVYHAAGASGPGLFQAAVDADRLTIGVDSNQYLQVEEAQQRCMLTSMLKRVDVAVFDAIVAFVDGSIEAGEETYTLENGGIGYATEGGQLSEFNDQIEDYQQQIIDGEIEVPAEP